jgi:hypothetical protein
MGTSAAAYWREIIIARAQKWGGVHRNTIRNNQSAGSARLPVAAA